MWLYNGKILYLIHCGYEKVILIPDLLSVLYIYPNYTYTFPRYTHTRCCSEVVQVAAARAAAGMTATATPAVGEPAAATAHVAAAAAAVTSRESTVAVCEERLTEHGAGQVTVEAAPRAAAPRAAAPRAVAVMEAAVRRADRSAGSVRDSRI